MRARWARSAGLSRPKTRSASVPRIAARTLAPCSVSSTSVARRSSGSGRRWTRSRDSSQLCARQGLFEVTEGIYQVRGLDLSNMTIVEGDSGVIVIDPLISTETAAAALALYRAHRGDRPVTGVIYTHSHGDHFGGVRGVVTGVTEGPDPGPGRVHGARGRGERLRRARAMNRRAVYMYGAELDKTPAGQIGAGLGMTTSTGTVSLIAADHGHHPHRAGGDGRRSADRVPAHPRAPRRQRR